MPNPQGDDLANRFLTGGKNPKPAKKKPESKEAAVSYTEADNTHYRILSIWGKQDA